ncbi:MAG: cobyric acid synthase [Fusobacterium sp.]|nr:cobyric acid synthase [Fusobacterium sp.]
MIMHKKIMIQGTGSSVGKTLIVAGLCRIFAKDGYKVSPFKSQNMALNSFVDIDGLEMSRGTVIQAECAYQIPRAFMNPILLKPNADNNSQLIVDGKAVANFEAKEYFSKTSELKEIVKDRYEYIKNNFDICVLEGGGSPAEINLRDYDIVNMGMAELVEAPVILVGNIEIGGVFASLYGTVMLLDEKDRKRIKGIIINKFRGDVDLLKPAIDILEEKFKAEGLDIKFLGVIPYENLKIEEEDSLSDGDRKNNQDFGSEKYINISIIKSKKMSNFTDFHIFKSFDDVRVQYVTEKNQLGNEDIIIIPGSKNTITDLMDLKKKGIFEKIKEQEKKGTVIVGICGGLQMLGKKIYDPEKLESEVLENEGFNFFDYETTFGALKKTEQVEKIIDADEGILKKLSGMKIEGYEIHQGKTNINKNVICKGNIFATYIHGIFDNSEFTNSFLNILREKKNLKQVEEVESFLSFKDKEYDKLEKLLRKYLNMSEIYKILF